jgi:hypothetical protein
MKLTFLENVAAFLQNVDRKSLMKPTFLKNVVTFLKIVEGSLKNGEKCCPTFLKNVQHFTNR